MKITIYGESGLNLDLNCIAENIHRLAPDLKIFVGRSRFSVRESAVSSPDSYKKLSRTIEKECTDSDAVLLFTEKPYDNNFFWQPVGNKAIISLYDWEYLTTVSRNNGVVYFLCWVLIQGLRIGVTHDDTTGCINDYLWNKKDIDIGMRSAYVCSRCLGNFRKHGEKKHLGFLTQMQKVLDDLSIASRTDMDICEYWKLRASEETFDVFLCHNSEDKNAVRTMNKKLREKGIRTWFDEEQLPPGRLWQDLLEKQIGQIKTAAILVGQSGMGPWQHMEVRTFIEEFVRRRCPVIPVILSDCSDVPELPLFLRQFMWVDFRRAKPSPFKQLIWGITGKRH